MNWIQKPWGWTACLYETPTFELWSAHVLAGGFSSTHWHDKKTNRLACRDAVLRVLTLPFPFPDQEVGIEHIIGFGQYIDIPPLVPHRFEVLQSGRIWETYWGQCHPQDIVRRDTNGWRPLSGLGSAA